VTLADVDIKLLENLPSVGVVVTQLSIRSIIGWARPFSGVVSAYSLSKKK